MPSHSGLPTQLTPGQVNTTLGQPQPGQQPGQIHLQPGQLHLQPGQPQGQPQQPGHPSLQVQSSQPGQQQLGSMVPNLLAETTSATWLAIGSLAESLGDYEKALTSYDAVLRHTPNNPDVLIKLANIYRSKDVFFKAAELYEQALNFSQENGETWGLLGHCYLMLDDLQRAYAAYQRALYFLDNPNVPKLWHGIGILYDRYGSLEYAEEAFVRVLDLDPNFDKSNEIYFRLGIIYKHQGKLQSALDCFQYILNNPPHPLTQPDVWFQIGSVLEQQKDWNGAKDAYEKVLQVNPQHAKVLQQLGCLYSQAESNPNTPSGQEGNNSNPPFQQDLNVALTYLTQSLEIDLTDAHSWYYLGRVHMIRGDFNAAYDAFQKAVNRDSRNPTFWCSIGVLYYQISQYRDALDAYTRAIRLNPYISEVWYDLGTLYETCNNQISDALDAYSQAERLDPGNPHIKARLEQLLKYQQEGNTHPPQPPPVSQQPRLPQGMVLESNQQPGGVPGGVPGAPQGGPVLSGIPGGPQPQPGHQPGGLAAPHLLGNPNQAPVPIPPQSHPAQPPQPNATQAPPAINDPPQQPSEPQIQAPPPPQQQSQSQPQAQPQPQLLPQPQAQPPPQPQPQQSIPTVQPTLAAVRQTVVTKPKNNDSNSKPKTNGSTKHDLEEKPDARATKKQAASPRVVSSSLNSLMNAAAAAEAAEVNGTDNKQVDTKPRLVETKEATPKATSEPQEENEEKDKQEDVEPPMRKVEEDENYDDDD